MSNEKPTFQVDQKIVYPSQGVGKIIEIKERKFKDEMILYYVIYLEVSDMTVLVPVKRCEELGIRAIVSPEEAQKALDMIGFLNLKACSTISATYINSRFPIQQ